MPERASKGSIDTTDTEYTAGILQQRALRATAHEGSSTSDVIGISCTFPGTTSGELLPAAPHSRFAVQGSTSKHLTHYSLPTLKLCLQSLCLDGMAHT